MSQQPATSGLEFFETLEKSDGWFGLVFRASGKIWSEDDFRSVSF